MTIPAFEYRDATVEEIETGSETADPGDPKQRTFEIEYGPRNQDSDVITDWIDELLETHFTDDEIVEVETDRIYVDEHYADWYIVVLYHDPETQTYRVPINSGTGHVLVDAASPSEAVERAAEAIDGDVCTRRDNRLTVNVPLDDVADVSDVEQIPRENSVSEPVS